MNLSFLFIIPLTPNVLAGSVRAELQKKCFELLRIQNYSNWRALVIGDQPPEVIKDEPRFIHLKTEGKKEEKLKQATEFIKTSGITSDYIIRLDDDDFFNPTILKQVATLEFDIYTDKYHTFFEYESQAISQQIRPWFPNTCIHKFSHAMNSLENTSGVKFMECAPKTLLIENDHSKIHWYYRYKKIVYAGRENPVYLRVLNKESITAKSGLDYHIYLKQFGIWKWRRIKEFETVYKPISRSAIYLRYNFKEKLRMIKTRLKYSLFYTHFLFKQTSA